jgi:Fur family ferric uptake transcriptional regulator
MLWVQFAGRCSRRAAEPAGRCGFVQQRLPGTARSVKGRAAIRGFRPTDRGLSCPSIALPFAAMNPVVLETIHRCRAAGLRRTRALEELIATLQESSRPMTLAELAGSSRLADQCDKATVFRLLQRLMDHAIVRRLGLHERAAYFTLLVPGKHSDYLICTVCGSIEAIQAPCPVHQLEDEIREKTGFRNLYHELEFFGICPDCS